MIFNELHEIRRLKFHTRLVLGNKIGFVNHRDTAQRSGWKNLFCRLTVWWFHIHTLNSCWICHHYLPHYNNNNKISEWEWRTGHDDTGNEFFIANEISHKKVRFFPLDTKKSQKWQRNLWCSYDCHMKSLRAMINCQCLYWFDAFISITISCLTNWFLTSICFFFLVLLSPNKFGFLIFFFRLSTKGGEKSSKTEIRRTEIKVSDIEYWRAIERPWLIDILIHSIIIIEY